MASVEPGKKQKHSDFPDPELVKELGKSQLTIFEPLQDLRYFSWKPKVILGYKKISDIANADEITSQIELEDVKPPLLIDVKSVTLPQQFVAMESVEYLVKYPYKMPRIVPLHVSKRDRGLDLDSIDFLFHGSAMTILLVNIWWVSASHTPTSFPSLKEESTPKITIAHLDFSLNA